MSGGRHQACRPLAARREQVRRRRWGIPWILWTKTTSRLIWPPETRYFGNCTLCRKAQI